MFEPGDLVFYTPDMPVPPIRERPRDIGTVLSIDDHYVTIEFVASKRTMAFLPDGLRHHPQSPKGIRQQMRIVLEEMVGAVQGRVAALVFSELTGHTAQKGLGLADVLRSFLDPRLMRKHRH
jgi:hypothetical protein